MMKKRGKKGLMRIVSLCTAGLVLLTACGGSGGNGRDGQDAQGSAMTSAEAVAEASASAPAPLMMLQVRTLQSRRRLLMPGPLMQPMRSAMPMRLPAQAILPRLRVLLFLRCPARRILRLLSMRRPWQLRRTASSAGCPWTKRSPR